MKTFTIRQRHRIEVNTDPQRRCYNKCHFSSELQWTAWEPLESEISANKIEAKLKFCIELNDYAVSQRGESAKREFEAVEETFTYTVTRAGRIALEGASEEVVRDFLSKTDKCLSSVYETSNPDEHLSAFEWLQDNPAPLQP